MSTPEDSFRTALERGLELFQEQRFHDAYEVWQAQWEEDASDGTDLLQGLLQLAVACSKLEAHEPQAALKLFERAREKLRAYAPEAYDLDVSGLLAQIDGFMKTLAVQ